MLKLLLLSGGLDSAVCLHATPGIVLCVGVDYGQQHAIELSRAEKLASDFGVEFMRLVIPTIPRIDDVVFAGRNATLISLAAGIAQGRNIQQVLIGCNKSDEARFPDCRVEFLRGMNQAVSAYGVSVRAPLLHLTKDQIVAQARGYGLSDGDTWTCYAPEVGGKPCGTCYACKGLETPHV